MPTDPVAAFLRAQRVLVLDGGLATSLEARGCDLDDPLWSAKILMEDPDLVHQVHLDFLEAGADCIASSSYQATIEGFVRRGVSVEGARGLLERSVHLAVEARDAFWGSPAEHPGRRRPLVAASVGPYGAFLADGSEYTGDYDLDADGLYAFHRERWGVFAGGGADVIACETIPSRAEVESLLRLLDETPGVWAWISLSCRDGRHLADGSAVSEVAAACDLVPGVSAVAVNCVAPSLVASLIAEVRRGTNKPVLVYPNSGERYDAGDRRWRTGEGNLEWGAVARSWVACGAAGIGGCCRVGADIIREIRSAVLS